jgi:hypothetical protein
VTLAGSESDDYCCKNTPVQLPSYRCERLPSSAEEGWPQAGMVLVNEIILINTTPSARAMMLRNFFLIAQPPLLPLRRGAASACRFHYSG